MDTAFNIPAKECDKESKSKNVDGSLNELETQTVEMDSQINEQVCAKSSHQNMERNLKLVAKFISQLVESQRDFSEQLGLAYQRVFTDGYEDFKGSRSVDVIKSWLVSGPKHQVKLARLLSDISKHQMALIAAADGLVDYTVAQLDDHSSKLFNKKFKNFTQAVQENPNKRFNELVAPGLASSYMKQREIQKSIK